MRDESHLFVLTTILTPTATAGVGVDGKSSFNVLVSML